MSVWLDLADDPSDVMAADGETIRINTASGGYALHVFFRDGGMEPGGTQPASPHLYVASADLPDDLAQGDQVIRSHVIYTVAGIQPDGYGLTLLVLRE